MQPFCIVHEYEGASDDFWSLCFELDYNRAFYGAVDVDFDVLRDTMRGPRRERTVRYRSRKPVPALLRSFLPDGLGYDEHATFDARTRVFEHRIEPNAFSELTDIRGTLRAEAEGAGRFRCVYEGSVSIRVPLLGAKLESNTVQAIKQARDTASVVTRAWLARRSAHAQTTGTAG